MATSLPYSHSPRLSQNSQNSLRHAYAFDPVTPIHSPHHSVHSSTSSRTPLYTLSIHEYRKQQNTPTPQLDAPSGKTLRRKPAASTLSDVERVPLISRTPLSASRAPLRPLHFSQSAHQLVAHQSLPPSPPHFDFQGPSNQPFRSQTAEPRHSSGTGLGYQSPGNDGHSLSFTSESTGKVSSFKSIKRLPKPQPFDTGCAPKYYPPLAIVTPVHSRLSPLQTTSYPSPEAQLSSNTQTTPSTFSFSRFPQPPHVIDPSLSPPVDDDAPSPPRLSNYTAIAPVTPPTTPAIIHYRGTSFDLINPHDSLLFHDIVTPSRNIDSTDYLLSPSSEDPLEDSDIMAPKRSLYGDLNSAYSSIARRADESPTSHLNLPLPPTPAALTPDSSEYSSPTFSYESNLAVSPLAVRKEPALESRFSLAQLTRSLTKKLVKTPELASHELEAFPRTATPHLAGQHPQPMDATYSMVPITYNHPSFRSPNPQRNSNQDSDHTIEHPRLLAPRVESAPLSSMVPDDPSSQLGRGVDSPIPRGSMSEGQLLSRPYYEDMASIYPSSSVYSLDNEDNMGYPPSLRSKRKSNPFAPLSLSSAASPDEYNRDSLYAYAPSKHTSRRSSRPLTQEFDRFSKPLSNEKTDTISKFIDQYGQGDATNSLPLTDSDNSLSLVPAEQPQPARGVSGFSQLDFDFRDDANTDQVRVSVVPPFQPGLGRKPMITQMVGSPPRNRAPSVPLAPAFEYDEESRHLPRQETSNLLSGASSYGDTRHLLQLTPAKAGGSDGLVPPTLRSALEPSSSYSQPSNPARLEPSSSYSQPSGQASPHTPQEALDQADQIFGEARAENKDVGIPAMWARRGSGNLLKNRPSGMNASANADEAEEEKGDWETVGSGIRRTRYSVGESIADYSSTESSRNSLEFAENGSLPVLDSNQDSSLYCHPSPLPPHRHPFSSSPPNLDTRTSVRTAPNETPSSQFASSPPMSSTVPLFHTRNLQSQQSDNFRQSHHFAPWAAAPQYTLSDKETQELLNSGPNEEILYEGQGDSLDTISSSSIPQGTPGLVRENTFEMFSILGPKGNLTGTPRGTGMHEVGSSVADTSSPGAPLSSPYGSLQRPRSGFPGFYAAPGRTASVTRIRTSRIHVAPPPLDHDRSPSEITLYPGSSRRDVSSSPEPSPPLQGRRDSVKSPTSPGRRFSRSAVHGQTKLRGMILAPDNHTVTSSQATHVSQFISNHCVRPSTADTATPLNPVFSNISLNPSLANEYSPHLLCPERAQNPELEAERRKTSWFIFALFCLLPPLLIIYRWMGDYAMAALTNDRLRHCSAKPKQVALGVGIVANISLISLILVPIIVAHASGAV